MNGIGFRNIWVSLGIMMPIAAVGLFLLRDDPEAKSLLALVLVIGTIALRQFLDRHETWESEDD